jgi:hypothetical protein
MNNRFKAFVFAALFFVMGPSSLLWAQANRSATPVITQSFASKEINPGETWKIYLNVTDPNGEMKNIYAEVDQPGVGGYPISIIRIKKENRKELSGYLYLVTTTHGSELEFVNITLTVQVQDKSGTFSTPAVFPLSFSSRSVQATPPQGVFKEQDLGPIMIPIRKK